MPSIRRYFQFIIIILLNTKLVYKISLLIFPIVSPVHSRTASRCPLRSHSYSACAKSMCTVWRQISIHELDVTSRRFHTATARYMDEFINSSSPSGLNGRPFADNHFKCNFIKETFSILIRISRKFVPVGRVDKKSALVQVRAWRRTGGKPLPEPMLT